MKNHIFLLLTISLFAAVTSPASAQVLYTLTDLGSGTATSINNNGQVVGYAYVSFARYGRLFDTTGHGNNINLGGSGASSINDNGQIVGVSFANNTTSAVKFVPNANGYTTQILGSGATYSINNSGQIVGRSNSSGGYPLVGYGAQIFRTGSSPIGLSGGWSSAYSNNNIGQIVGYDDNFSMFSGHKLATMFDSTGNHNHLNLGTLPGYNSSAAWSINDNTQIVGEAYIYNPPAQGEYVDPEGYNHRAVLFDSTGAGNNIYLGNLNGFTDSTARSINEQGQIVGNCYKSGGQRATLFDPTGSGNNIDLNTVIAPIPGWTLTSAYCINNNGWIVGEMYSSSGDTHAFMLTPVPEPSTIILLAAAVPLILRRKKRD